MAEYVDDLMEAVTAACHLPSEKRPAITRKDPPTLCASFDHPAKQEALAEHKSRFKNWQSPQTRGSLWMGTPVEFCALHMQAMGLGCHAPDIPSRAEPVVDMLCNAFAWNIEEKGLL